MTTKRGRPRLAPGQDTKAVSLRLPKRQYADLVARAKAARLSMPEFLRRTLGPNFVTKN